jgi:hypothetical protein
VHQTRKKEGCVGVSEPTYKYSLSYGNEIHWISFLAYPNLFGNKVFEEEEAYNTIISKTKNPQNFPFQPQI